MEKDRNDHAALPTDNYADDISVRPVLGEPMDCWDQINKYGTYEVQDTTDTDNTFPASSMAEMAPRVMASLWE